MTLAKPITDTSKFHRRPGPGKPKKKGEYAQVCCNLPLVVIDALHAYAAKTNSTATYHVEVAIRGARPERIRSERLVHGLEHRAILFRVEQSTVDKLDSRVAHNQRSSLICRILVLYLARLDALPADLLPLVERVKMPY